MASAATSTGIVPAGLRRARTLLGSRRAAQLTAVVLILGAWQFITPLLETRLVPMPAAVFEFMWNELRGDTLGRTTVYQAFGISLRRLGIGLAIAFAIGTPIGMAMGAWKPVDSFFKDFTVVGLAMPSLVWALLTGMWFGLGNLAPVITVILAATPFVVMNAAEGVRDVPRDLSQMGRAFGMPRGRVVRHIVFPSLMPFFFAALRYGLGNGWKGLVLAEVWAATDGAGWNIRYWYDAHRAAGVVGYALFFVIFALLVERWAFEAFSRRVFRWRPSSNVEVVEEDLSEQAAAGEPALSTPTTSTNATER
jgi:ABC-type nitrate/sulfonate/bicarbonate transport system permease component